MSDDDIFRDDWVALVRSNIRVAQILIDNREWGQAYHHAGTAVECALKARIMKVRGLNRWPSRSEDNTVNVHKLETLARKSDVRTCLERLDAEGSSPEIVAAWMIAKDWFNEVKYKANRFPEGLARDMVDACIERGLIEWILS